jgi:hypothetical protein
MITIQFRPEAVKTAYLRRLLEALYPIEDDLEYKGSVSKAITEIQDILEYREKHEIVTINGIEVGHFHYNEGAEELEVYDKGNRIICSFEMSESQWNKISSGSFAKCWDELVALFADPIEEV